MNGPLYRATMEARNRRLAGDERWRLEAVIRFRAALAMAKFLSPFFEVVAGLVESAKDPDYLDVVRRLREAGSEIGEVATAAEGRALRAGIDLD